VSEITFEAGHCPACGELREAQFTHMVTGEEKFLHHTLAHLGVPQLHILRAHNGYEYRFYELSGDLPEALHFRHFEQTEPEEPLKIGGRIRLKEEVHLEDAPANPARDRVRIKEEKPGSGVKLKSGKSRVRLSEVSKEMHNKPAGQLRKPIGEPARSKSIPNKPGRVRIKIC
jgi:hypothetical protein